MMKKFVMIVLLFALLLTACGKKQDPAIETEVPTQPPTETSTEATTEPTVAESIPGVEDSIFDDEEIVTQATEATEPEETVATTTPTETKPSDTAEPTKPSGSGTGNATEPTKPQETKPATSEYEKFQSMSATEQQKYMESFDSVDDFFAWYNKVKTEHEAANPPIDVGDGSIDLDQIIGN